MANYYDPKAYAKLPGRSKFDLSFRNSFSAKMGLEYPVVMEPVIPGDRFRVGLTYQMQLAPMLNPVYDGLEVNFEAFFVPNRIIDRKWREFWTGYNEYDQTTQLDIAPLTLNMQVNNVYEEGSIDPSLAARYNPPIGIGSLADFLGVQFGKYENGFPRFDDTILGDNFKLGGLNALPFLAYLRIHDDWYRNERVQRGFLYDYYNRPTPTSRNIYTEYNYNGDNYDFEPNTLSSYIDVRLFHRNYKKDRFTTALPEPIIGGDVRIPVNQSDPFDSSDPENTYMTESVFVRENSESGNFSLNSLALGTIQQLKLALKEYSYRMKDTYNGNRYVESLHAHYGVVVPDSTLQRSIYLGSARDYVNFGEVYQTSSGDGQGENGALGDYAGRGAANGTHYLFDESFYEPGFFFVLMSISPRLRYFQGIKRLFTRFERADYFSPEYQNIGDDFISESELFVDMFMYGNDESDTFNYDRKGVVFGYNSRWIEYKNRYDELHGEFANPDSSLYNWNFARDFSNPPVISDEFSKVQPINKPFVDFDNRLDNYFVDCAIKMEALRPILAVESF